VKEECALDKNAIITTYKPNKQEKYDLVLTLQGKKSAILTKLKKELRKRRGVKCFLSTQTNMIKDTTDGAEKTSYPFFRSKCNILLEDTDLEKTFDESVEKKPCCSFNVKVQAGAWNK